MTENLAGRGEGLAGLVAELESMTFLKAAWHCPQCRTHGENEIRDFVGRWKAALEAAAPAGTAHDVHWAIKAQCAHCVDGYPQRQAGDSYISNLGPVSDGEWFHHGMVYSSSGVVQCAAQYIHEALRRAALATPSPQAPAEQSNAFSTTSTREQSAATASANLSVADLKPLKDACDRDWEDESPLQIICIAANAIYWRDVELSVLKGSSDYANGFNAGRESLSTPLTPYGERIADCLRTAVEWNDDYMRINKLYGKVDWVEWAKKLLTGNLEKRAPAATQQPAGSGAQTEQSSAKLKCGCQPIHSTECVFRDVRSSQYRHFYEFEKFGSPRKVGEDAPADDMTYTETIARELALRVLGRSRVPISSYDSEAKAKELVDLLSVPRPSSVPVGEQKQEEGV